MAAQMNGKFIDKTQVNVDRTTNATGIVSAIGAISSAIYSISHERPVGDWLPMVFMGLSGAIAQWLQGSPSQGTKLISSILRLEEAPTNAALLRRVFDRLLDSGVVPGVHSGPDSGPVPDVDLPRDYRESRALNDVVRDRPNPVKWISAPESIAPNTDKARSAASYAADVARGYAASPEDFIRGIQDGDGNTEGFSRLEGQEW